MSNPSKSESEQLADAIGLNRPKRRFKHTLYIVLPILIALILAIFWYKNHSQQNARPIFETQEITQGDIRVTITATGNLAPTDEVSVGSELSGTTREVLVDSNEYVTKGQILAKLDTNDLENKLKAARAQLQSSQANVVDAEVTLKENQATLTRQQKLFELSQGQSPSQAVLDASVAAVDRAQANLLKAKAAENEAQAQVAINENNLKKSVICSPTDGIILSRSIEPGQTVAASFSTPELFVIAKDLSHMILVVAIAEADIGVVEIKQKAHFTVDAWPKRNYKAIVSKIAYGSKITDNVVTYETELSVENEDLSLRPGMTATAEIATAHHKNVLRVPVAALRFDPPNPAEGAPVETIGQTKKSFIDSLIPKPPRRGTPQAKNKKRAQGAPEQPPHIWILRNDQPVRVDVEIGISNGQFTEVSAQNLQAGELVIINETRKPL
jgi:HlyD family secretion protein